jgi:hypothetical protein
VQKNPKNQVITEENISKNREASGVEKTKKNATCLDSIKKIWLFADLARLCCHILTSAPTIELCLYTVHDLLLQSNRNFCTSLLDLFPNSLKQLFTQFSVVWLISFLTFFLFGTDLPFPALLTKFENWFIDFHSNWNPSFPRACCSSIWMTETLLLSKGGFKFYLCVSYSAVSWVFLSVSSHW